MTTFNFELWSLFFCIVFWWQSWCWKSISHEKCKAGFILKYKAGFIFKSKMLLMILLSTHEVMSVYLINQYQNAILWVMPLHELKQVQLQEHFTLMTHDCTSMYTLHERFITELQHWTEMLCSSPLSVVSVFQNCSAFQHDSSISFFSNAHSSNPHELIQQCFFFQYFEMIFETCDLTRPNILFT